MIVAGYLEKKLTLADSLTHGTLLTSSDMLPREQTA
jgi:hypothetical protein